MNLKVSHIIYKCDTFLLVSWKSHNLTIFQNLDKCIKWFIAGVGGIHI